VLNLEALMLKQSRATHRGLALGLPRPGEEAPAGDEEAEDGDVQGATWMRKRLVDEVPLEAPSPAESKKQLEKGLRVLGGSIPDVRRGSRKWLVCTRPVRWQRQVGPSCGITGGVSMFRNIWCCIG